MNCTSIYIFWINLRLTNFFGVAVNPELDFQPCWTRAHKMPGNQAYVSPT